VDIAGPLIIVQVVQLSSLAIFTTINTLLTEGKSSREWGTQITQLRGSDVALITSEAGNKVTFFLSSLINRLTERQRWEVGFLLFNCPR